MLAWTEMFVPVAVGAVAGVHAATWGMYKDAPHEGFTWRTYLRSVWVGAAAGPCTAALFHLDVRSVSGLFLLFGATYAAERLAHELYKTFLRREDQSKYFIPMALHVGGRVVRDTRVRLLVGALYLGALFGVGLLLDRARAMPLDGSSRWLVVMLLGSLGGWVSAFGGAWKDAPLEGFQPLKFFRSPAIALLYAMLCARFTNDVLLIAVASVGYTVATTETYKTFFFLSTPRGKFAGKPVRFPHVLHARQYLIPVYAAIWLGVLSTAAAAFARAP